VYDYGRWTWHVSSTQTRRLLRGSVAESFVRISDVPVLLVRDAPRVEPEVDARRDFRLAGHLIWVNVHPVLTRSLEAVCIDVHGRTGRFQRELPSKPAVLLAISRFASGWKIVALLKHFEALAFALKPLGQRQIEYSSNRS
jgi:hypothetical protein